VNEGVGELGLVGEGKGYKVDVELMLDKREGVGVDGLGMMICA
jgi:hypothetical protein